MNRIIVYIQKGDNMIVKNDAIFNEAVGLLKIALNDSYAEFRDGQYEAIESVFTNKRTLVVQKTGWGKSIVYFISTKINRNKQKGVSIVISPLLVLIENQIEAAKKVGLKCEAIFSGNIDHHDEIIRNLKENKIDILFTTPESLFNKLQTHMNDINLGMFIIDEAHCISDWGHDFRLEYRKIVEVLNELRDKDFPILATTATANNRVIEDLKSQIGPALYVSKGSLYRNNLFIQLLDLKSKANRYAWILQNIRKLSGTGIIYCLTTKDCDDLANFLANNDIHAKPYHSNLDEVESSKNIYQFSKNELKVLVSTIKLGMGYDKPDVAFIIHYQVPKNIVSYYQQIGRAARKIDEGFTFMLRGGNDFEILNFFIDSAFPEKTEMELVLKQFENIGWGKSGLSTQAIAKNINISFSKIKKALKFLEFEHVLNRVKQTYFLTSNRFHYKEEHYQEIKSLRKLEIKELENLFETTVCLNRLIIQGLDDMTDVTCGKCKNCLKKDIISSHIEENFKLIAEQHIADSYIPLRPREKRMYDGMALSKYGDEPIGNLVSVSKYSNTSFPEAIYIKAVKLLTPMVKKYNLKVLTFVPSLNNKLMDEFARNLSKRLGLTVGSFFSKLSNVSQKTMTNFIWQKKNAQENYALNQYLNLVGQQILLIDDIVDSGYTLSALGEKLLDAGAKGVYPFALADASNERIFDND
jgi:ATP-dependent DNA helicase RecQ